MTEPTWRVMSANQSCQSDVLAQAIDEADAIVVGIGQVCLHQMGLRI